MTLFSTDVICDIAHTCSARVRERCLKCGYKDTRDAFEGWERGVDKQPPSRYVVRCPTCEALHPDQSNHDAGGCDACYEDDEA